MLSEQEMFEIMQAAEPENTGSWLKWFVPLCFMVSLCVMTLLVLSYRG